MKGILNLMSDDDKERRLVWDKEGHEYFVPVAMLEWFRISTSDPASGENSKQKKDE